MPPGHARASATPAGPPTAPPPPINAHPHTDQCGRIAVIHNGIIENSGAIRKALEKRGHTFKSETDTEVLAHLIGEFYQGDLEEAVAAALRDVDGAYGIAVICGRRARRAGGGPQRVAAAGRRGRGRVVRRLRRVARCCPHPVGGLSGRRRNGGAQPGRATGSATSQATRIEQAGQPDRVGPGHHRAGRLRPLHAEGDLRAAGERAEHPAGPPAGRRGHRPGPRPQPDGRRRRSGSTGSSSPPAARPGTPG